MITLAEENYLKAILSISLDEDGRASTNAIAQEIGTTAASVSDVTSGTVVDTVVGFTVDATFEPLEFTPVLKHLYTLNSSVIT